MSFGDHDEHREVGHYHAFPTMLCWEVRDKLLHLLQELKLPIDMHTGDHFCTFRRYYSQVFIKNLLTILAKDPYVDLSHIRRDCSNYEFLNDMYHYVWLDHDSTKKDYRGDELEDYIKKKAFASFRDVNKGAQTLRVRLAMKEEGIVPHTLEQLLSHAPPQVLINHESSIRYQARRPDEIRRDLL
jgi:hypothetical protein